MQEVDVTQAPSTPQKLEPQSVSPIDSRMKSKKMATPLYKEATYVGDDDEVDDDELEDDELEDEVDVVGMLKL
jgi:predicted Ser/Thr protein kinase